MMLYPRKIYLQGVVEIGKKCPGFGYRLKIHKNGIYKAGEKGYGFTDHICFDSSDSVANGEIKNLDTVKARVRSALFDYKFKPAELHMSINSQNVVVRDIKLPILKEKEIET